MAVDMYVLVEQLPVTAEGTRKCLWSLTKGSYQINGRRNSAVWDMIRAAILGTLPHFLVSLTSYIPGVSSFYNSCICSQTPFPSYLLLFSELSYFSLSLFHLSIVISSKVKYEIWLSPSWTGVEIEAPATSL